MGDKSMDRAAVEKAGIVFAKNQTPEEVIAEYDDWATNYDEMLNADRFRSPNICAEEVFAQVPENQRSQIRVLDVAAGTGLVGKLLSQKGFKNMDALDPSEGMLKKLEETGLYNLKFNEFIGMGNNTVPRDTYDMVLISGGMGSGHIPVSGIDDLIKFSKSGGKIIIVMREEFLETAEAYKDKLEPHMKQLEKKGVWKQITRKTVPNYFMGKDGIVFTYQKA